MDHSFSGLQFPFIISDPVALVGSSGQVSRSIEDLFRDHWNELHSYVFTSPESCRLFYVDWESKIPNFSCNCMQHWRELVAIYPPDFSSGDAFFEWGWARHNDVNERLGKPRFSFEEAKNLYGPLDGIDYVFWQPFHFGGLERWAYSLVDHMPRAALVLADTSDFDAALKENFRVPRISLEQVAKSGKPILFSCLFDAGKYLPKDRNCRTIAVVHGACDYTRNWIKSSHEAADEIVGISPLVSQLVTEWTGRECTTISDGIDTHRITSEISRNQLRDRYDLPRDAFVVGYCGRIAPEKQVHKIIEGLEYDPQAYALIVGWDIHNSMEDWLAKSDCRNRVRYFPAVTQVGDILNAIDVFVSPTKYEGYGLAVMEAMYAGIPTVTSNTGIVPALLDSPQHACEVTPVDVSPKELAKACRRAKRPEQDFSEYTSAKMAERWKAYLGCQ